MSDYSNDSDDSLGFEGQADSVAERRDMVQTPPSPWDPSDLSCLHPCLHHPASLKYPDGLSLPHVDNLNTFVADLSTTIQGAFPREQDYGTVHTLFISWKDGMSGVKEEITRLDETLRKLRFATSGDKYTSKHFEIPNPRRGDKDVSAWPTATLKESLYKALVKRASKPTSLLIIYYGGHSRIDPDLDGASLWFAKKTSQHLDSRVVTPFVNWSEAVRVLRDAHLDSNILFLLDCCAGLGMIKPDGQEGWQGTTELLSATSKSSLAAPPGDTSFTSALIRAIEYHKGRGFNINELHAYMVHHSGLRTDPFRVGLSARANRDSIFLRYPKEPVPRDQPVPSELISSTRIEAESQARILFSVRLRNPSIPVVVEDWTIWLRDQAPPGISSVDVCWGYVRPEGVFHGRSTLLLMSLPIAVWNLLPHDKAYSYIDIIQSENLMTVRPVGYIAADLPTHAEGKATAQSIFLTRLQKPVARESGIAKAFSKLLPKKVFKESARREALKTEPTSKVPAMGEPSKTEPTVKEPPKTEPKGKEPPREEPTKTGPMGKEPPSNEPPMSQWTKFDDPAFADIPFFKYQPVSEGCFRLLKIRPGWNHGNLSQPFFGHLIDVFITDWEDDYLDPYYAVSWSWEDGGRNRDYLLLLYNHGRPVQRLPVSYSFLEIVQSLQSKNGECQLWVDAICINMADMQDRAAQIGLIPSIFASSSSTVVWLGPASASGSLALEFVVNCVNSLRRLRDLFAPDNAQKLAALWRLLQASWFSRRWVLQEVVFSKRPRIHYGNPPLSWDGFTAMVELLCEASRSVRHEPLHLANSSYEVPSWIENFDRSPPAALVRAISKLRLGTSHRPDTTGKGVSAHRSTSSTFLEELVTSLSVLEVTYPQDVVYSLLSVTNLNCKSTISKVPKNNPKSIGLTMEAPLVGPRGPHRSDSPSPNAPLSSLLYPQIKAINTPPDLLEYPIDYDAPISEFCLHFIKHCLVHSSGSFDILCRPWYPSTPPFSLLASSKLESELPSWVCTLSGSPFGTFVSAGSNTPSVGRKNADILVGSSPSSASSYSACGGHMVRTGDILPVRDAENSYMLYGLSVRGMVVDTIEEITSPSQGGAIPREWLKIAEWNDIRANPPEGFWRTLVADRDEDGRSPPPMSFARLCKDLAFQGGLESGAINTMDFVHGREQRDSLLARFCRRVQAVIWNRALVKTAGGRLGLVARSVRAGDKVCVLWGCSVPVILRSEGPNSEGSKLRANHDITDTWWDLPEGGERIPRGVLDWDESADNSYKLIGECYINGIMDGQIFSLDSIAGLEHELLLLT